MLEEKSVLILPKALKTQAEIDGYFACHLRDGSALTAFFCWLEHHVVELEEKCVSVWFRSLAHRRTVELVLRSIDIELLAAGSD